MQIELTPIDQIIPYARNPRKNDAAIAKVAGSIQEYGFRQPIVVDEDMVVVAGHTRLQAAYQLKLKEVPIHIATGLSAAQIKAYRIADNRTAQEAEWDEELLALEIGDLAEDGFDINLTGFDETEIESIMASLSEDGLVDDDDVPEAESKAVTQTGDVWIMGEHRLICGDSTEADVMIALMDGQLADMIFTDPPYNIDYEGSASDRKKGRKRNIKNDSLGDDFYQFLFKACEQMLSVNKGAAYICMASSELHTLFEAFTKAGGKWSNFIIWAKNHFTMGRSDYQRQYEPILYGWSEGNSHFWCGDRNQSDVWHYDRPQSNDLHPTMKPVELVSRAIRNSSKHRDVVLDSFGGSGSTLIACEKLNRQARLIELDPIFCDVIVKRWEQYTGQQATLLETGASFTDISKQRANGGKKAS